MTNSQISSNDRSIIRVDKIDDETAKSRLHKSRLLLYIIILLQNMT